GVRRGDFGEGPGEAQRAVEIADGQRRLSRGIAEFGLVVPLRQHDANPGRRAEPCGQEGRETVPGILIEGSIVPVAKFGTPALRYVVTLPDLESACASADPHDVALDNRRIGSGQPSDAPATEVAAFEVEVDLAVAG